MSTETTILIVPCPFCGSTNVHAIEGSTYRWVTAECIDCGARCGEIRSDQARQLTTRDKTAALTEWNRRA